MRLCVLFCAAFVLFPAHAYAGFVVNFTGQFGDKGPFGGTGFEGGSFSGMFTVDPLAVDQYDSSQPQGNMLGIYDLEAWSINFFTASNVILGHAEDSHGGTGIILITQDPVATDQFGNINLDFEDPADSFSSDPSFAGLTVVFGASFNSPSITTDLLPTSFLDATYTGDGILAVVGADPDTPATFIESAAISTPVPEPASLLLLAFGIIVFAATRRTGFALPVGGRRSRTGNPSSSRG